MLSAPRVAWAPCTCDDDREEWRRNRDGGPYDEHTRRTRIVRHTSEIPCVTSSTIATYFSLSNSRRGGGRPRSATRSLTVRFSLGYPALRSCQVFFWQLALKSVAEAPARSATTIPLRPLGVLSTP